MKGQGHKKVKHQGRRNPYYLASHFGKILVTLGVTLVLFYFLFIDDVIGGFVMTENCIRQTLYPMRIKIFEGNLGLNCLGGKN